MSHRLRSMAEVLGWNLLYGDGSRVLVTDNAPPGGAIRRPHEPADQAVERAWREHRRSRLRPVAGKGR